MRSLIYCGYWPSGHKSKLAKPSHFSVKPSKRDFQDPQYINFRLKPTLKGIPVPKLTYSR